MMIDCIVPNWPAPACVNALLTTRRGGVSSNSKGAYASLNLAMHVNDSPANVAQNRALLRECLPNEPKWLQQVHGATPIWIEQTTMQHPVGDAALSRRLKSVCAILVADCLPIFLCDKAGTVVGVVHAGWRGLIAGIIEQSVAAMRTDTNQLLAWLGPAIGPDHFEVGDEVRAAFVDQDPLAAQAFTAITHYVNPADKKWFADIFLLARQRLESVGISEVYGGGICTYSAPEQFFSYRRDGETGRMAALIWLGLGKQ